MYLSSRGKVDMSVIGYGIELVKKVNVRIPVHDMVTINVEMPTLLSRANEGNNYIRDINFFFERENGSIAVSQAMCTVHMLEVILGAREKQFTKPFLDNLAGLQKASEVRKLYLFALINIISIK